ncbi:hypothetical protein [Roseibium aggregatum]|uniref:Uncharacterized protein n=1 Tax=Roseibium aggregatum TaxID=187304 RepID=A0A926NYI8_9HYPH|nr:hypothetical protein [Roseibium aggregatum]MBD1546450.1 hypothetical protein [Roseibium aggregatum]
MAEPNSSATIRALADLAELSATQLEEGRSVDDVIEILRKAAKSVRSALDPKTEAPEEDFTPVDLKEELEKVEDLSA